MLSKETYLFKDILDLTIQGQVQGFGLIIFFAKIPRPHNTVKISEPRNSSGSSEIIYSTKTSWSSG